MIARAPFLSSAAALLLPLASACSQSVAEPKHKEPEAPPVSVKLTAARTIQVPRVLSLSGTLAGLEEARVAAGAAGKVIATHVERGSVAKKGSVMVRLDARIPAAQAQEAAAQVESLRAQQVQAQLDRERTKNMFEKGAISKADFDKTHTQCETSKWSLS